MTTDDHSLQASPTRSFYFSTPVREVIAGLAMGLGESERDVPSSRRFSRGHRTSVMGAAPRWMWGLVGVQPS